MSDILERKDESKLYCPHCGEEQEDDGDHDVEMGLSTCKQCEKDFWMSCAVIVNYNSWIEDGEKMENKNSCMCGTCPLMLECPEDGNWEPCRLNKYVAYTNKLERAEELRVEQDTPKKAEAMSSINQFQQSGVCPKCSIHLEKAYNLKYCGDCGQRIDWKGGGDNDAK